MIGRIWAVVGRYIIIHFRSPARTLELFFWPVMELFLWGFFAIYLRESALDQSGRLMTMLLSGLIFWDILFRSQQTVSLAFMEELWTRNVLNMIISPLRTWEWVAAAYIYGLLKTAFIVTLLMVLASILYAFDISSLGFYFVPLMANLLLMGWSLGLFTTGLLLRWGHSAEALIWGVPFLLQPFSAIFYPLSVYPQWLKPICLLLPSTHVLEGMRITVQTGLFPWNYFFASLGLNIVFALLSIFFYVRMLERGRENGQLVRITG